MKVTIILIQICDFFRTSMLEVPAYIEAVNKSTFCVKATGSTDSN